MGEKRREMFSLSVSAGLVCSLLLMSIDAFRVTTNEPVIERLLGQDVKIPCFLSGYEFPEVDLKYISIRWIRKSPNGNVSDVYRYEVIFGHKTSRPGSKISENDLKKGDAGLYIPQVQVADDGEYTCIVFYTPDKGEVSSTLHVLVQPIVEVNPPALGILIGTEKSVTCDVINFYPVTIDVRWIQYRKDGRGSVLLERNVSMSRAALNKDGTYNVTGYLMLHPQSAGDDGTTYGCLVKHRSLTEERAVNFTLSVKEPRGNRIVSIGVLVAFAFLIMCISGLLWLSIFKKVTPTLSMITGNKNLIHMGRAALSCHIMNVRQESTEICVSLKRRGGEKMDFITRKCEVTETSSQKKINPDEGEQLMERGASSSLPMQMEVILDGKFDRRKRLYHYCCSILITPDIEVDNEAELTVSVRHDSLNHPISETCTLNVIGVTPTLSKIKGNKNLIHMDRAALSCRIKNVRQGSTEICVSLKRRGGEKMYIITRKCEVTETSSQKKMKSDEEEQLMERGASSSQPMQMEVILCQKKAFGKIVTRKRLYDYSCSIFITPDIEVDNEAELTVSVRHDSLNHPISETRILKVIGVPPKLSQIVVPRHIIHGDSVALACSISGFKPRPLMITWLKRDAAGNETQLLRWDSGETEVRDPKYSHQPSENKHDDHSFSILSSLLRPSINEDHGAKYICRVFHPATGSRQEQSKDMEVTGTLLNFSEYPRSQEKALWLLGNDSYESLYAPSWP